MRQVLVRPVGTVELDSIDGVPARLMAVGSDWSGRLLEIIVVPEPHRLVVIHVMDLRKKFRWLYERGVEG